MAQGSLPKTIKRKEKGQSVAIVQLKDEKIISDPPYTLRHDTKMRHIFAAKLCSSWELLHSIKRRHSKVID